MRAEFDKYGALIVYAENHTEAYALKNWSEKYMNNNDGEKSVFCTDSRSYLDKEYVDDIEDFDSKNTTNESNKQ